LPEIFALLDQPKRVFLVQQMMWGHASEYNRASGKTNTQYYSEYLDLVVSHLREKGQLERTLIVLTSDHGLREKDHQLVPDVYRVPLWFYHPSFSAHSDDTLYSHLDFKALLLAELTGTDARPKEAPFVLIVGTTGSSLLAVMKRDEMFVIKDRPFASYLLPGGHRAIDGRDLGRANPDELGTYLKLFHTYREGFGPPR
jgi:arylsulfatase A-like enzyme